MHTQYSYLNKIKPALFLGVLAMLFSACGTYNDTVNRDSDGIYTSEADSSETEEATNGKSNYYKQYFESKDKDFEDLPEDGAIFTDIEAYSTTETIDDDGYIEVEERDYNESYGAWGTNSEQVTVNVYNYGGFNSGSYWNRPFGYYNSFWGYGYRPHWNIGFNIGWGSPFYGGFYGYGYPYYAYGYGYPYYGGYYGNGYGYGYGNGYGYAHNRGRRNTDYSRGTGYSGRTNANTTRRGTYTRDESTRRVNSSTTRIRNSNTRSNTTRNSNTRTVRATPPTRNSNTRTTRSTPTRSSNTRSVRSSSSTRSSGTVRSSGSTKSSGSSSRSGGSSRRGGGLR